MPTPPRDPARVNGKWPLLAPQRPSGRRTELPLSTVKRKPAFRIQMTASDLERKCLSVRARDLRTDTQVKVAGEARTEVVLGSR